MTKSQADFIAEWINGIFAPLALLVGVAGPIVLAGQVLYWLRVGQWIDVQLGLLPAWFGFEPSEITWVGLREILVETLDMPMWFGLPLLGIAIMLMASGLSALVQTAVEPS